MHSRAFFRQWYYGATHTFFFFTAAPSFYWQKAMYKKNSKCNSLENPAATATKRKGWRCVHSTNCANDVKSIRNFINQL